MNNKEISLKNLTSPHELSRLDMRQCEKLCGEIRENIIRTVMKNGGHLSSNLGTVELAVAIHRVFRSPADKIIWDVGHQAYAHKLLTGRYDDFGTLRKKGGISGFCRPEESEHDAFISGHSSTSISAALGMAEAMRLDGDKHHAVAVIGDGAFTGGLAYEGLNNAGKSNNNLIVILNHNDMSISKNVGAFAKYLTSIRGNTAYINAKNKVEYILGNTPIVGEPIKKVIQTSKSALKSVLYHSTMFEDMGFVYLGPIDGHNISELEDALRAAKKLRRPVFVHVNTIKGKGFRPAEINPGAFHAIPSCGYRKNNPNNDIKDSFSEAAGKALCRLAAKDSKICAVTAAMKYATGLQYFASEYPERFFDVGIAEQHAVTFAAGLAKGGRLPFFAVYSSFLQRSYDQIIHDASIDRAHIVIGIDRAGFSGEDGETHQGIFDVPMLLTVPGITVFSPSTYKELELCMETAFYRTDGVAAVRYPKGGETLTFGAEDTVSYAYTLTKNGNRRLAVGYGRIIHNLYAAAENCDVLKLVKLYPVEEEILRICKNYDEIFFFEEGSRRGGIGEYLLTELYGKGYRGKYFITAPDGFIGQASMEECLDEYGLSAEKMKAIFNNCSEDSIET